MEWWHLTNTSHSMDDSVGSCYFHYVRIHKGIPFVVTNKGIMVTSLLDTVSQSFFYYLTMEPPSCWFVSTQFDSINSKHNSSSHKWSQSNIKPLLPLTHNHKDDVVVFVVLKTTTLKHVLSEHNKMQQQQMHCHQEEITLKTMTMIINHCQNDGRPLP